MVEQPRAMSTVRALMKASSTRISLTVIPRRRSSMTCMPASLAKRRRAPYTAGMVPFPGRPKPKASVMQFMELAVNIPAQEPQPGQASSSSLASSSMVMRPALTAPTASKIVDRSTFSPRNSPGSIGPPLTTTVGKLQRAAAINMPGTILSQLGISTKASKLWAWTITSTESAMSSRLARE